MGEQAAVNYAVRALDRFAGYHDDEAIIAGDRRITYSDLRLAVPALATEMRRQGITPGSAIAILTTSRPEMIIFQLAAHLLGCRTVWMTRYAALHEMIEYLDRATVQFFVYDTARNELAASMLTEWPGTVLCLGGGGIGPDLLAGLDEGAAAVDPADLDLSDVDAPPESVFYTSGTTGHPKLVHHGQRFFDTLLAIGEYWVASGSPALVHLGVTGFSHVSGQIANLLTLFTGGRLVLMPVFTIPDFLDTIAKERITSTLLTPVQLYEVLDHPALADADVSSLVLLSIGGAPTSTTRLRQAIDRFGTAVRLVYGLSEAAFVTEYRNLAVDPEHPQRLASCGYPFADARIEVRDGTGTACPTGTTGEVWVTGGLTMNGYWDDSTLTGEVLIDGWLKTGDVGYLDEDGYLYLVDRSKDMIITGLGAMNIYTRPVEDVLASHPQVRSAAVFGVPDPEQGEAVCAFVVPTPGATVTAEELRDLVAARITVHHAPSHVEFIDAMPLAGIGKVDKKALRATYLRRQGSTAG